ncbi:orotidine-5'-phosphate decarboxylase [Nitratireductor sp. ZSWI3]|uniref:orotidine-5'-phosphate decarboxylase n=1 Tax=Nitratireductor sp. ZSWI3 TaxID=2966359 RepID=UPI00214FF5F8|nr:orotidine-5'-phosphate decarboxylase [Nitratireductor sp. ZSWI3]MCR4268456.1 orotidine-5'-phosphate decarboxylase [Nitratireductor sp. ZSWI3]
MEHISWTERARTNAARFGPLAAGIDPHLPDLPAVFDDGPDWILRYTDFLLSTIIGSVGFVKFQAAYFEACGLAGMEALSRGMKRARAAGIGVVLDAKRGDIDATSAAYAHAYLVPQSAGGSGDFEADCMTVNPLMGPDTLEPFVEAARRHGKGVLILCRTSNPGAAWLQDRMSGNRAISDRVADLIRSIAETMTDEEGLSPVGAVIGATAASEARRLRELLPNSIILAPGMGAQGGDVATIRALRGGHEGDLIVPVSRGLLRVGDRSMSRDDYGQLLLDRIAHFHPMAAGEDETAAAG